MSHYTPAERFINLALRLSSLAAKLVLTLYMGKFFELSSIGAYGLILSSVVLMTSFLGQGFDYVVRREIVGVPHVEVIYKTRDEVLWQIINLIVFGLVLCGVSVAGTTSIQPKYFIYAFILISAESIGTIAYNNMNLLNQQLRASLTFFLRAAAWIPVVVFLGWLSPDYRNEDTVLTCWAISSTLSLAIPLWTWKDWGWAEAFSRPINWPWIIRGLKISFPIWIGTIGSMGGDYIDRYFVSHYLTIEHVGIMTFYYSFVNAFAPLIESGVLAFSSPRLVALHKEKDRVGFRKEIKQATWQISIGATVLALALSVFVPVMAYFLDKPAILQELPTFWLMLTGAWLASFAILLYLILFAQHLDKPIWLGNMLFIIPASGFNLLFVSTFGFIGIGYSAIASMTTLVLWRLWFVRQSLKND